MRPIATAVLLLFTWGCAPSKAARVPEVSEANQLALASAADTARLMQEAQAVARARCEPLRTRPISWAEEHALGAVVTVKLVARHGGLALDGLPEQDPDALVKDLARGKPPSLPPSPKNDLAAYVNVVGRNLARYSSRPGIEWTFAVLQNEQPVVFSAPGGYVVLSTGMLARVKDEAQLAGLLAHEIGHVVHRHTLEQFRKARVDQCLVAVSGAYVLEKGLPAAGMMLPPDMRTAARFAKRFESFDLDLEQPDDGGFITFLMDSVMRVLDVVGHDPQAEYDADATALELLAFAGYDAIAYEQLLTALGEGSAAFPRHPKTGDRVAKLKTLREGSLAPFATGTARPPLPR